MKPASVSSRATKPMQLVTLISSSPHLTTRISYNNPLFSLQVFPFTHPPLPSTDMHTSCPRSKKCLSAALESAKEKWMVRKRRCVAIDCSPGNVPQLAGLIPLPSTVEVVEAPVAQPDQVCYTNNKDLTALLNLNFKPMLN